MSIIHCEHCGQNVDTDFNSEHFNEDDNGCENTEDEKPTVIAGVDFTDMFKKLGELYN
jgi:hypothetical protein